MRIVQLSDLHLDAVPLFGEIDAWAALTLALRRVQMLQADLLLISGDLAESGAPQIYRRLAGVLGEIGLPLALMPGNHDSPEAMCEAFPMHWDNPQRMCRRLDIGPLTLLLLDTTVAGAAWGEFGDGHLAWLEANCPAHRPCIVVMHHPPFPVGIAGMDEIACRGAAALADWLRGQPQVEALWCGHVHRPVFTVFAGKPAVTAPSTVHQIALQDGPLCWTPEPSGLLVHDYLAAHQLRTHYLPLQAAPLVPY